MKPMDANQIAKGWEKILYDEFYELPKKTSYEVERAIGIVSIILRKSGQDTSKLNAICKQLKTYLFERDICPECGEEMVVDDEGVQECKACNSKFKNEKNYFEEEE